MEFARTDEQRELRSSVRGFLRNVIGERMLGLPKDLDPDRGRPFNERSRG